jgi:glycosyltransferase involved in cell wall biosynthesis
MRILWVKAGQLLPVDTGGKIRTYNLLKELARQHEVTLLSYYGGPRDTAYDDALRAEFALAEPLSGCWPLSLPGLGAKYVRWLPTTTPFAVGKFTAQAVRSRIVAACANARFDVAICDFLAPTANFPASLPVPTVLFQHNVESALWARQAQHERSALKRPIYRLEAHRMAGYEAEAVRRFDHVIAVSEHDRALMSRWVDAAHISVTPTGVNLAQFRNAAPDPGAAAPLVVFVGSMDWGPNEDGMLWFHRDVWPRVVAAMPSARLRIVGRHPPPAITQLAGDAIEVTGTVPSVIEHLHAAAVVIVPLRIGGGTRLKVYEAMAARRPVVATTIGAEGLDYRAGEDILIADAPGDFADAVIGLLRDPARRSGVGLAAERRAAIYDWPNVVGSFAATLRGVRRRAEDARLAESGPGPSSQARRPG